MGLDPEAAQLTDQVAPAGQRDVPFVAEPARDDRDRAVQLGRIVEAGS
jgi:hypothetical protein